MKSRIKCYLLYFLMPLAFCLKSLSGFGQAGHNYSTGCKYAQGPARPEAPACPACKLEYEKEREADKRKRKEENAKNKESNEKELEERREKEAADAKKIKEADERYKNRPSLRTGSGTESPKKGSRNELTQAQKDHLNYLNDMKDAGDKAMKSGDYSRAVEIYQEVQKSGGYVDEKRMNKALAGSLARSTGDVLNSIPDPSGHKAVLAIDYALIDKFTDLDLTLRNKAYWSDYFSFNFAFGASYRSFEGLNEEEEAYRVKRITDLPQPDANSFVVYNQQSFQTVGYKFDRAPVDMLGAHAMFDLAVNIPIRNVAEIAAGFFAGGKVFANLNDKGGATLYSYGPFAELSIGKLYFRYEHTTEGYSPGVNGPYFASDHEAYFGKTIPERNSPISLNAMDDRSQKFNYGRLAIGFRWTLL